MNEQFYEDYDNFEMVHMLASTAQTPHAFVRAPMTMCQQDEELVDFAVRRNSTATFESYEDDAKRVPSRFME